MGGAVVFGLPVATHLVAGLALVDLAAGRLVAGEHQVVGDLLSNTPMTKKKLSKKEKASQKKAKKVGKVILLVSILAVVVGLMLAGKAASESLWETIGFGTLGIGGLGVIVGLIVYLWHETESGPPTRIRRSWIDTDSGDGFGGFGGGSSGGGGASSSW